MTFDDADDAYMLARGMGHQIFGIPLLFHPLCPRDILVDRGHYVLALDAESVYNVLDWWNAIEELWPELRGQTGVTLWEHCRPIPLRPTMFEVVPAPHPSWRNPHDAWPLFPPDQLRSSVYGHAALP